jgi:hypothetical protein
VAGFDDQARRKEGRPEALMSYAETIITAVLVALIVGNIVFQLIVERRNPPVGRFIEVEGIRLHYIATAQ